MVTSSDAPQECFVYLTLPGEPIRQIVSGQTISFHRRRAFFSKKTRPEPLSSKLNRPYVGDGTTLPAVRA